MDSSNFDDLLPLVPAIDAISKNLDVQSLKALSLASNSWCRATVSPLEKRCAVRINDRSIENTLVRNYYQAEIRGDANHFSIPTNVTHLKMIESTKTTPEDLRRFHKLTHLELVNCDLDASEYTKIQSLVIEVNMEFPGFYRNPTTQSFQFRKCKCFDLENVVFHNLRECEFKLIGASMCLPDIDEWLVAFVANHPALESFTVTSGFNSTGIIAALRQNCPGLKHLNIANHLNHERRPYYRYTLHEQAVRNLNDLSLSSLKLTGVKIYSLADLVLENLTTFHYDWDLDLTEPKLWIPNSTKIEHLSLFRAKSQLVVKVLAERLPNLKTLEIGFNPCWDMDEMGSCELANLESLTLLKKTRCFLNVFVPRLKHFAIADLDYSSNEQEIPQDCILNI